MLNSRLCSCTAAAVAAALLSALPGSPAQPPGKEKPTIRLTPAGELKIPDLNVRSGAVIAEDSVVLVGTKESPADPGFDPRTLDPNGAIVDLTKKTARPFTNGHKRPIESVSYARGRIATCDIRDPVLRVWDLKAGKTVAEVEIEKPDPNEGFHHYGVACFHKSDRVAVAADERLVILDPARPDERTILALPPEVRWWLKKPVVSPDDTHIACTAGRCGLVIWEMVTQKATTVSLIPENVDEPEQWFSHGCTFGPMGALYAWRSGPTEVPEKAAEAEVPAERRSVVGIPLPEGKVIPLGLGTSVYTLHCAIDPTGTWMAVVGTAHADRRRPDGTMTVPELRVYRLKTRELVFRGQMDGLGEVWVAFTPSGKRLVTANHDGRLKWWDVQGK
jgi:WD40 repeat protein